jgi:hypothetical protein
MLTVVKSAVEITSPESASVAVALEVPVKTVTPVELLMREKARLPPDPTIMASFGFSVGR